MEWLRWILLAVGTVLIGAIYVAGRRQRHPTSDERFPDRSFGVPAHRDPSAPAQTPAPPASDPDRLTEQADPPDLDTARGEPWVEHDLSVDPVAVEDAVELDDVWPSAPEREAPQPHRPTAPEPAQREPEPEVQTEPRSAALPEEADRKGRTVPESDPEPSPAGDPEPPRSDPGLEPGQASFDRANHREHAQDEAIERSPAPTDPPTEKLVVLFLAAYEGERLVGAQLAEAFARHGLEHGELGAFHARSRDRSKNADDRPDTEFSIANVVEPGSFDPATMGTLSTPGVVLFLRIPGPPAPLAAFERMVVTARDLARELGARVLDDKRTPLTRQSEQLLRDELRELTARLAAKEGGR